MRRNVFVFVGGFVAAGLLAAACGSESAAPEVVIAAGQPAAVAPEVAETTTTTAAPEEVATEPEPVAEAEVQTVVDVDEEEVPEVSTPEEVTSRNEPEEVAPVARIFEQDEQGRYIIYDESDDDMIFDLFPDLLEVTTIFYGDGYVLTTEHKREGFPTDRIIWRGSYEELLARGVDPSEIIWVE